MILVAGGSGRLGTVVVRRLAARGLSVRVMTRDRARTRHLADRRIEVVGGDVRDRATVFAAIHGVDVVVSAVHGFAGPGKVSPASVDRDGNFNLIDGATAAGAAVVLTSVVGASPGNPMELHRMKYEAEEHLRASPVPWTVVRATSFMELWIELLQQTAGRSGRPLVFVRGNNPINFVSVADVAALIERVVMDASARGLTFEIGGPENLTFNQLATTVQQAAGRQQPPRHVPRLMLRAMAYLSGYVRPEVARQGRAALAMDTLNLTFDANAIRLKFPDLTTRSVRDVLSDINRPNPAPTPAGK